MKIMSKEIHIQHYATSHSFSNCSTFFCTGEMKQKKKQDVFVKHKCHRNGHFLTNVNFIFDLDLCR